MKTCPFCAEQVQDAAVVCKHCGRDFAPPPASKPVREREGAQASRHRRLAILGILLGLAVVTAVYVYLDLADESGAASPIATALRRSAVVEIAQRDAVEIGAGRFYYYMFTLPARACQLTGRIEGISGGNRDFEAFVMDEDNYRNWISDLEARGSESGRVTVWSPNVAVMGPGLHYLVVSNAFSVLTPKTVSVTALATCP